MLGIKNYRLDIFNSAEELTKAHPTTFSKLIGQSVEAYFVQWHTDRDEWNEDGPIILLINGLQFEFTANKLDYSMTINQIDLSKKLDWYGSGDEMPLAWKKNPFPELNSMLGRQIEEIFLLEYSMTSNITDDLTKKKFFEAITPQEFLLVGIEFKLLGIERCLHLSNGLDCNEMKFYTTRTDIQNKRFKIE